MIKGRSVVVAVYVCNGSKTERVTVNCQSHDEALAVLRTISTSISDLILFESSASALLLNKRYIVTATIEAQ